MLISHLATLLKANIPLLTALNMLAELQPVKQKKIILLLKKDISAGLSLSEAMQKQARTFDPLTIALIKAGEEAALLPLMLENIAHHQEKTATFKKRLQKALFYPLTVLSLAALITTGLLIFIIPQFESLFENMGAQLPLFTRMILFASRFIQQHGFILFILFILLIFILIYFKDYLPFLGKFLQKLLLARFSYTLSLLLSANIPIIQALQIASNVLQHKKYEKALCEARENIKKGESFFQALQKTRQFPLLFLQFIQIGEHASQLKPLMLKISEYYEIQADHTLSTLTLLLEPAIMVILGILIGGLVIAMYLPVFQLGKIL